MANKICVYLFILVLILCLAFIVSLALRVEGLKGLVGFRDSRIESLESELNSAERGIRDAKENYLALRDVLIGVRAERDSLVESFGNIRQAIGEWDRSFRFSNDIIAESIVLVDAIIEVLAYLEGIRIY